MPAVHLKIFAIETEVKRLNAREELKGQILFSSEWQRNEKSEKFGRYFFFLAEIF